MKMKFILLLIIVFVYHFSRKIKRKFKKRREPNSLPPIPNIIVQDSIRTWWIDFHRRTSNMSWRNSQNLLGILRQAESNLQTPDTLRDALRTFADQNQPYNLNNGNHLITLDAIPNIPNLLTYADDLRDQYLNRGVHYNYGPARRTHGLDKRFGFGLSLNQIDIKRQNVFNHILFNIGNQTSNDLVKMKNLSGKFYRLDNPAFSGMILPGQESNGANVRVISCFHGFWNQNINLNDFHFVPYFSDLHNDFKFQVLSVNRLSDANNNIEIAINVQNLANEWMSKPWNEAWTQNDYLEIIISTTSVGNLNLENLLTTHNMILNHKILNFRKPNQQDYKSLFVFGKSATEAVQNANIRSYTLLTNVLDSTLGDNQGIIFNNRRLVAPKRANADTIHHYPYTSDVINLSHSSQSNDKLATTLPMWHGMSGAPIVECGFAQDNNIRCNILGVVHGSQITTTELTDNNIDFLGMVAKRNIFERIVVNQDAGYGNAFYITGADDSLGNWQTAYKLTSVGNTWTYFSKGMTNGMEFKILRYIYVNEDSINIQNLANDIRWEFVQNQGNVISNFVDYVMQHNPIFN